MKLDNYKKILLAQISDKVLMISKSKKAYFEVINVDSLRGTIKLRSIASEHPDIKVDKLYYYVINSTFLVLLGVDTLFKTDFSIEEIHLIEPKDPIPLFEQIDGAFFTIKQKEFQIGRDFKTEIHNRLIQLGGTYNSTDEVYIFVAPIAGVYRYIEESRNLT